MSAAELLLTLPLLVPAGTVLVLLGLIAAVRRPGLTAATAVTGLAATAVVAALGWDAAGEAPLQLTALVRVDRLALLVSVLLAVAGLAVVVWSRPYLLRRAREPEEYHLLVVLATLGGIALAAADHFAALLLGLELMSVSLYALVAYPDRGRAPVEAGLKYLVLSTAASAILLFGLALIYGATGSLAFEAFTLAAPTRPDLAGLAAVLVLAGLGFKISLVPFHLWTPEVYQGAPPATTALLATLSKAAVVVVLLRLVLDGGLVTLPGVGPALGLLALASMIVGNLLALRQDDLRRLLACSSIAHLGYLTIAVVAVAALGGAGARAVVIYLAVYLVMTLAAFGVVCAVAADDGEDVPASGGDLAPWQGLLWRRPLPALVLLAAILSLAGIPLTGGFVGKLYLFLAAVDAELWVLLGGLIVGTVIGLYYYLRVILAVASPLPGEVGPARFRDASGRGGDWLLAAVGVMVVVLGVHPQPLIAMVESAVAQL